MTDDMLCRESCRRAGVVPPWFTDVLHAAIYADADDAHRLVQVLSAILAAPPPDRAVLAETAAGPTQGDIAGRLGVSRHRVCRQLRRLRRTLGDGLTAFLRLPSSAAPLLAVFVKRSGPDDPNVRVVVERLQPLTRNEIGVLFGMLRRQTKGEILGHLGIGHTRYHQIKVALSRSFYLSPARRMRESQLRACIADANLVQSCLPWQKRT